MNCKISKYGLIALTMLLIGIVTSCDKDDDRQPVVYSVRLPDPEKADSTFVEAFRGTMIVIQGKNLDGIQNIYINGTDIGFNTSYNTSTHMIVTIPGEMPLTAENPEEQHLLRIVTNHGETSFAFRLLAPYPVLNYFKTEWAVDDDGKKYMAPGQIVTLHGENFYDVERIYTTNVNPYPEDESETTGIEEEIYEITNYSINSDMTQIDVTMPEVIFSKGWFVLKCHSGTATLVFKSSPAEPIISDVSCEMPVVGEQVVIYGKSFIDVLSVQIGEDDIVIPAKDLEVSETQDQITFRMPSVPTSQVSRLKVVTEGGRDDIEFYNKKYLLSDFDEVVGSWAWGGNHYTQEDGPNAPATHSGNCHGLEGVPGAWNWWWGQLGFTDFVKPTNILASTPVDDIELRFECYAGAPFDDISIHMFLNDLEDEGCTFDGQFTDYQSEEVRVGEWYTVSIPLSNFTNVNTYGDYDYSKKTLFIGVVNPSDKADTEVIMYVDNFRFYIKH